jgi:tetratricopeptide (TPR) repeat protein
MGFQNNLQSDIDIKSPHIYLKNAAQSIASGSTDDAILYLKQGIRYFPDDSQLLRTLGNIYRRIGNPVESAKFLERALGLPEKKIISDRHGYYSCVGFQ